MANKAQKLLDDMRQSSANWKRTDLERLYIGFGFVIMHGAKHDIVKHPDFPQFRTVLPRHNVLAKAYVRLAVELVDQLVELQKKDTR